MRRASIVLTGVTALVAFARPAYPCLNEVMRQEEAIKMVNAVEQALEKADYEGAQKALKGRHVRIPDEAIAARVQDARTLIALRVRTSNRDSLEWAVTYFDGRAKGSKDLKFKACSPRRTRPAARPTTRGRSSRT